MTETSGFDEISSARPSIAIIGGGGAMGRLLARLLRPAASTLTLIDYFGTGTRPASLELLIDELRNANQPDVLSSIHGLILAESLGGLIRTTSLETRLEWRAVPFDPRGRRAWATFGGSLDDDGGGRVVSTLAELHPDSECDLESVSRSVVLACQPEDTSEVLPAADIVVLALAFESRAAFASTVQPYLRWIKSGSLVVDLGSTKTQPLDVLCGLLRPEIDIIGAHPLFGPVVSDLTGLSVALVEPGDGRPNGPWREWLVDQFTGHRLIVTRTNSIEHDDAMAFVQALTHFTLLSFANTFVRLNRDPTDLLPFRTPIFEPLLYLAARVASLAGNSPDTYRSIQAFSTRPDARIAFVEAAREILAAIEQLPLEEDVPASEDALSELFRTLGAPWSPIGRERKERQRREHLIEMGGRLVDGLNRLRQDVVASVGQVRAIEERRSGQAPRVVVGLVDLDLRDPRKYDLASQVRLRRLNLALGSVTGDSSAQGGESTHDIIIPVARARLLTDVELYDWLYQTNQLVDRRSYTLLSPSWFDRETLKRLYRGGTVADPAIGQVCDVEIATQPIDLASAGVTLIGVTFVVVLHPAAIVRLRQAALGQTDARSSTSLQASEDELQQLRAALAGATDLTQRAQLDEAKNQAKHRRKALVDRRNAEVDREVRRGTRAHVTMIAEAALQYLLAHGCAWPTERVGFTGKDVT